ncbi:MAG: cysteine hydrolase [Ignavibacteriaceae bacterium]|nr:cysteine hydrolase [Ignavibacteriaceae bacterium]
MKKSAIIVIDMLNEYLRSDGLVYCEQCKEIIPIISDCINFARKNNILVIYLNTALNNEKDILAKKWGLHAVAGSVGAQVIEELKPVEGDLVIKKKSYNGFFNTTLDSELKYREIKDIAITGIHTHVCVLLTAVGGFELGYNVTTIEDAITTGYKPNHESRLRFFKTHTGDLVSSAEWKNKMNKNV